MQTPGTVNLIFNLLSMMRHCGEQAEDIMNYAAEDTVNESAEDVVNNDKEDVV